MTPTDCTLERSSSYGETTYILRGHLKRGSVGSSSEYGKDDGRDDVGGSYLSRSKASLVEFSSPYVDFFRWNVSNTA